MWFSNPASSMGSSLFSFGLKEYHMSHSAKTFVSQLLIVKEYFSFSGICNSMCCLSETTLATVCDGYVIILFVKENLKCFSPLSGELRHSVTLKCGICILHNLPLDHGSPSFWYAEHVISSVLLYF